MSTVTSVIRGCSAWSDKSELPPDYYDSHIPLLSAVALLDGERMRAPIVWRTQRRSNIGIGRPQQATPDDRVIIIEGWHVVPNPAMTHFNAYL
jgi:hypothetical protein